MPSGVPDEGSQTDENSHIYSPVLCNSGFNYPAGTADGKVNRATMISLPGSYDSNSKLS